MNYLANQSINNLRKNPVQLAGLVKDYRSEAAMIEHADTLSRKGKDENLAKLRGYYKGRVAEFKRSISADADTVREKLAVSRPGIEGIEGEMKHSRLFGRVQAQVANGGDLQDVIQNADRDTLDVIRTEAPYHFASDNEWAQKLITQRERSLMTDNERESAEALDELDAGLNRLQMGISQIDSELAGTGQATYVPSYDANGQGHNLLPSLAA